MDILEQAKVGCIDCPYNLRNKPVDLWDSIMLHMDTGKLYTSYTKCFIGPDIGDELCTRSYKDENHCQYSLAAAQMAALDNKIKPEKYLLIKDDRVKHTLLRYLRLSINELNKEEVEPIEFLTTIFEEYRRKGLTLDDEPSFSKVGGGFPTLKDGTLMMFDLSERDEKVYLYMGNNDNSKPERGWLTRRKFVGWISNGYTKVLFPEGERSGKFIKIPKPTDQIPAIAATLLEEKTMKETSIL